MRVGHSRLRGAGSTESVLLLTAVALALLIAVTLFGRKLLGLQSATTEVLDGGSRSTAPVTLSPGDMSGGDTGSTPASPSPSAATVAPTDATGGASPLTSGSDAVSDPAGVVPAAGNAPAPSDPTGATPPPTGYDASNWNIEEMLRRVYHPTHRYSNALLAGQVAAGPEAFRRFLEEVLTHLRHGGGGRIDLYDGMLGYESVSTWIERLESILGHFDAGALTDADFDLLEQLVHSILVSDARRETTAVLMLLGADVFANPGAREAAGGVPEAVARGMSPAILAAKVNGMSPGTRMLLYAGNPQSNFVIGRAADGTYYAYAHDPTVPGGLLVETFPAMVGSPPNFPPGSKIREFIDRQGVHLGAYEVHR